MSSVSGSSGLLDILKQKMQQSKDELEKYKEESERIGRSHQEETLRREEAENHVASLNRKISLLEEDIGRVIGQQPGTTGFGLPGHIIFPLTTKIRDAYCGTYPIVVKRICLSYAKSSCYFSFCHFVPPPVFLV